MASSSADGGNLAQVPGAGGVSAPGPAEPLGPSFKVPELDEIMYAQDQAQNWDRVTIDEILEDLTYVGAAGVSAAA